MASDEHAGEPGEQSRRREGCEERQTEPIRQDGVGVAPGGQERRVTEARLAGVAGQHHQAHVRDGPDQDVGDLAQQELVEHEGRRHRESN